MTETMTVSVWPACPSWCNQDHGTDPDPLARLCISGDQVLAGGVDEPFTITIERLADLETGALRIGSPALRIEGTAYTPDEAEEIVSGLRRCIARAGE